MTTAAPASQGLEIRIFENGRSDWKAAFEAALTAQCYALGVSCRIGPAETGPIEPDELVIYFGAPRGSNDPSIRQRLQALVDAGNAILPVLEAPTSASQHLPREILQLNAFSLSRYAAGTWQNALVDEVLSLQWLPRRLRKIFISYRRVDSEAIARQLFERFTADRFEVFLDDVTIPPGQDFQKELKWWLNDADMVLLLVSPNLEDSKWVLEEITFAKLASIGLLGVRWPEAIYGGGRTEPLVAETLDPDQQWRLPLLLGNAANPKEQTLPANAIEELVGLVHLHRARGLRQRLVSLLPLAQQALASEYRVSSGARLGDLELEHLQSRDRVLARVLPFRPTTDSIYGLHQEAGGNAQPPQGIGLFYDENDPHDRRFAALRWLLEGSRHGTPGYYRLWTAER